MAKVQRIQVDGPVLGLLRGIYQHASREQQKHYDEAIEELREEVRGCRKEFALLQELFLQAIKARLNPNCAEVNIRLLKELQGLMKKEERETVKRELEGLLEEEVVFEGEEEGSMMESEQFSFGLSVRRPPTSAAEVGSFVQKQC